MGLPGVDTEVLRAAIDRLQVLAEDFAKMQSGARSATLVREALYPIHWLTAAANLEDARLEFLAKGDADSAAQYEEAQRLAFDAYQADLERFRSAFSEIVPDDGKRFAALRMIVDRGEILNALSTLEEGVRQTRHRFTKRSSCFGGAIFQCDSHELAFPSVSVPEMTDITAPESERTERIIEAFQKSVYIRQPESTKLVLLSKSLCTHDANGARPVFSFSVTPDIFAPSRMRAVFVGDIYFLRSERFAEKPFFEYFAASAMPYVYMNPLTSYECANTDYELGKVFAIRAVAEYAKNTQLSKPVSSSAATAQLSELETRFGSEAVVTERDAAQYLQLAAAFTEGTFALSSARHELASLALQLNTNSLGFLNSVLELELNERANLFVESKDAPGADIDFSALNLFFVRSGFGPLFMMNNPSATGDHPALFDNNHLNLSQMPYTLYSSFEDKADSMDIAVNAITFYKILHRP
jgi:hypothetical protein